MIVLDMKILLAIILCSAVLGAGSQDTYSDSDPKAHEPEDIRSYFDSESDVTECVEDCDSNEKANHVGHYPETDHSIYTSENEHVDSESPVHEFEEHVDYENEPDDADNLEYSTEHDDHSYTSPSKSGEMLAHQDETKCPQETSILSPYYDLCKRISLKLLKLESRYPELKSMKLQLLQRLDIHASDLDIHLKEGESPVSKFLELLISIANQLKEESEYKHKIHEPLEKIIAEDEPEIDDSGFVRSIRGIPGVHYPNYTEVPITSFSCSDKSIPGFYADLEADCQVFHVCYEHRRESFLCPPGTIFNQPILACDYWYSANCSQASNYYDVNDKKDLTEVDQGNIGDPITTIIEKPDVPAEDIIENDLKDIVQFLPVKAKIAEYPKDEVSVAPLKGIEVAPDIFKVTPKPIFKPEKVDIPGHKQVLQVAKVPIVKIKPVKIPIPFAKIIPVPLTKIFLKPKIAKIPAVKAKLAKAVAADVALAKSKVAKSKLTKAVAIDVALAKSKLTKTAAIPVVKAKVAEIPVLKTKKAIKYVKSAVKPKFALAPLKVKASVARIPLKAKALVISPLTKKALAMGYKKLLLSKKLFLVG